MSVKKARQKDLTLDLSRFVQLQKYLDSLADKPNKQIARRAGQCLQAIKEEMMACVQEAQTARNRKRALRKFIDDFPSMLGYWDKSLHNVHSNKAYAEYFGKTADQIRGLHIKHLLGPDLYKLNRPFLFKALAGEVQTFRRTIPTPSGTLRQTLANYVPHHVGKEVAGLFVIVTDISSLQELEEKNRQIEATLIEKSRLSALGEMASGIAHEINNPLSVIYANACMLSRAVQSGKVNLEVFAGHLAQIEATALRIEKIIDGLRLASRQGEQDPLEKNDLAEIVEQTVALCEKKFQRANIILCVKPLRSTVEVSCRKVQISQIILNILNNAYDALVGCSDGVVTIRYEQNAGHCDLAIENNGPEIPAMIRDKIFSPYVTTKPSGSGVGLGLSISKNLAKLNDGDLFLSPKKRTQFVLRLKIWS